MHFYYMLNKVLDDERFETAIDNSKFPMHHLPLRYSRLYQFAL